MSSSCPSGCVCTTVQECESLSNAECGYGVLCGSCGSGRYCCCPCMSSCPSTGSTTTPTTTTSTTSTSTTTTITTTTTSTSQTSPVTSSSTSTTSTTSSSSSTATTTTSSQSQQQTEQCANPMFSLWEGGSYTWYTDSSETEVFQYVIYSGSGSSGVGYLQVCLSSSGGSQPIGFIMNGIPGAQGTLSGNQCSDLYEFTLSASSNIYNSVEIYPATYPPLQPGVYTLTFNIGCVSNGQFIATDSRSVTITITQPPPSSPPQCPSGTYCMLDKICQAAGGTCLSTGCDCNVPSTICNPPGMCCGSYDENCCCQLPQATISPTVSPTISPTTSTYSPTVSSTSPTVSTVSPTTSPTLVVAPPTPPLKVSTAAIIIAGVGIGVVLGFLVPYILGRKKRK